MQSAKPILGILLGDSAGVGPELVAKLASSRYFEAHCRPILIGDARIFERALGVIGKTAPVYRIDDVAQADWSKGIPLLDQMDQNPDEIRFGQLYVECGAAVKRMLELAVALSKTGAIAGFCFAPFNKTGLKMAGCPYESEHHLMAHLFQVTGPFGEINMVDDLFTTRTTSHIPIKDVSANLSVETILRATRLCNDTLLRAGIARPRVGFAALNPHCGEGGLCGREEIEVITPAIEIARNEGIQCFGPFSSDTLFIKAFAGDFDGVVTMYHDQGQIALKLRGFDHGVTIAGGMPVPIVTCSHGTAYDIAGTGVVNTGSFENAVKIAGRMASVGAL